MIKAALFDLDGVVFDTEPQYSVFWGSEGKRYFPEDPDFARRIKGMTLDVIYETFFSKLVSEQPKITARLNEYERNMKYEYVAGFPEFIKSLKNRGLQTAVVTSSNVEKMQNVYRNHPELKPMFDDILTAERFSKSKPDPDCYLKAAASFGLEPRECIGFEDSFNGLRALRAAKVIVVGVATTNSAEAIMPLSDVVISNYLNWKADLKDYIR